MFFSFTWHFPPHSLLQSLQETCDHIMILQLLTKDKSLDGIIIGEESNQVLNNKPLAVSKQVLGRVNLENGMYVSNLFLCLNTNLGMNIIRDDAIQINEACTSYFTIL